MNIFKFCAKNISVEWAMGGNSQTGYFLLGTSHQEHEYNMSFTADYDTHYHSHPDHNYSSEQDMKSKMEP